ncbi:unnamed protein product [Cyclocybe aegerita]|uniref:Uncharacterized protein n=1 Tax=Cyclocybe aegerita TaxID=1973307 RepID=A0A8S0VX86_CYCAE|nr:unnamed protein product [Cyclocybe aegerita]
MDPVEWGPRIQISPIRLVTPIETPIVHDLKLSTSEKPTFPDRQCPFGWTTHNHSCSTTPVNSPLYSAMQQYLVATFGSESLLETLACGKLAQKSSSPFCILARPVRHRIAVTNEQREFNFGDAPSVLDRLTSYSYESLARYLITHFPNLDHHLDGVEEEAMARLLV